MADGTQREFLPASTARLWRARGVMCHDDARMVALCTVGSAQAQALPEYPLTRRIEGGYIGAERIPYEFRAGRLTVAGHEYRVAELLASLGRLAALAAEAPVQSQLFAEAA